MTGFGDLNLKIPSILAISILMSRINFMLNRVENENSFITLGPVFACDQWSANVPFYSRI